MTTTLTHRRVRVVPIVLQCLRCSRYHHVAVRFEANDDAVLSKLPDNCSCGEPMDTHANVLDCIGTARNLMEAAMLGRPA